MIFSHIPDVLGRTIAPCDLTWDQIVQGFQNPPEYPSKAQMPLFKLARFGDKATDKGCLRHDDNMLGISGIECDYDGGLVSIEQAHARMQAAGILGLFYTTPTHTPEKPRWRFIAPTSTELPVMARKELAEKANLILGGILAQESFTQSQSFYYGRCQGVLYQCLPTVGVHIDRAPIVLPKAAPATLNPTKGAFEFVTPDQQEDIISAMKSIPTDDYNVRIAVGQCLVGLGDVGYNLYKQWHDAAGRVFANDSLSKWNGLGGQKTGYASLFKKAAAYGWENPKSARAQAAAFDAGAVPWNPGTGVVGTQYKLEDKLGSMPDQSGRLKNLCTIGNLKFVMLNYGFHCYYDEILKKQELSILGNTDPRTDLHNNAMLDQLRSQLALNEVPMEASNFLTNIFSAKACNPIHEWITGIPWDGRDRLPEFYNSVLPNDPEDAYYRDKILNCWMLQCVAAMDSGEHSPRKDKRFKFECILIFQGSQGRQKSTWLKYLVPENYRIYLKDGVRIDVNNKDSIVAATSGWIVELSEFDGTLRKSDISSLKAFLSQEHDIIRLPYDRCVSEFKRRTSYFATVNEEAFLIENTGQRRMLPLKVRITNPHHNLDMQQVWAQFYDKYSAGEQWWPDAELIELLPKHHDKHTQIDHIEDAIATVFNLSENEGRGDLYTCTQIIEKTGRKNPNKAELNNVGRVLRAKGFKKSKSGNREGYRLMYNPLY